MAIPNIWPLGNIYNMWMLDPAVATQTTSQGAWYFELFVRYLRLSTYLLLTLFQYQYLYPKDIAVCKEFAVPWVAMVYVRNLAIGWLLYGGWHYILYMSPLKDNMKGKKFNPQDQYRAGTTNLSREMLYTTSGLGIGESRPVVALLWSPYLTHHRLTQWSDVVAGCACAT